MTSYTQRGQTRSGMPFFVGIWGYCRVAKSGKTLSLSHYRWTLGGLVQTSAELGSIHVIYILVVRAQNMRIDSM